VITLIFMPKTRVILEYYDEIIEAISYLRDVKGSVNMQTVREFSLGISQREKIGDRWMFVKIHEKISSHSDEFQILLLFQMIRCCSAHLSLSIFGAVCK